VDDAYQKLSIAWKLDDFLVVRLDFLPVERAYAGKTKKTYINPRLPNLISNCGASKARSHEHAAVCKSRAIFYFHGESVQTPAQVKSQAPASARFLTQFGFPGAIIQLTE
jgi:hypothetical protein